MSAQVPSEQQSPGPDGQRESNDSSNKDRDGLPVLFHDAESGEPIQDVVVEFHGWIGEGRINQQLTSDENGRCELKWDGNPKVRNLWFTAQKSGYVPVHRDWRSDRREIVLPDQVDVEFVKSKRLEGVVQDEAGNPIENASVKITLTPLQSEMSNYVFNAATVETDQNGKWSWDGAPEDAQRIGVRVEHPDYIRGFAQVRSVDGETVATLRQGLKIRGQVFDPEGSPVEGATVCFATDIWGSNPPTSRTDEEGRFELINCQPGKSAVTVQAKGFAPHLLETTASTTTEPLEINLEPGNKMHLKVVDPAGVPISGAHLAADTWLGYRTLSMRTNADLLGEYVWNDAPAEAVEFHVLKDGFVANRKALVFPGEDPQIITLYPELTIAGTVKTAESNDQVDQFRVIRGYRRKDQGEIRWEDDRPIDFTDGAFRYTFSEPRHEHFLKVVANGFEPETSRAFRSDEGEVGFIFLLEKGWSIRGHVRRADGSTVDNATLTYATSSSTIMLRNGRLDLRQSNASTTSTDRTGRFTIHPTAKRDEPFMLLAICDEGLAIYRSLPGKPLDDQSDEVAAPFNPKKILKLELVPWGRVEGTVYAEGKPEARRLMAYNSTALNEQVRPFRVWSTDNATSNDEGKFEFATVPAGVGSVSKVVIKEHGNYSESTYCWQTSVDVVAGETTSVDVAKNGIVVKGKVSADRTTQQAIDWGDQAALSIRRVRSSTDQPNQSSPVHFIAIGELDRDGGFEIPSLPPGGYLLTVKLSHDSSREFSGINQEIGSASQPFTIEPDQIEALDLGQVVVKVHETLDPGDPAPDLFAEDVLQPGKIFQLRDYHGKLVLLNFWNRTNADSKALMETMKRMRKRFSISKFQVVSLFVGSSRQSPKDQISEGDSQWRHGTIHGLWSQTADDYTIKQLPATFLIGPDGTVIAKDLDEDALLSAISDALLDKASFQNAGTPRPRFSLTKTGAVESSLDFDEQDPPSVLVTTGVPDLTTGQVDDGKVRFLTRSGKELWSFPLTLSTWDSSGARMAVDSKRNRIYVRKSSTSPEETGTTSAFDLTGQNLWSVECEGPMAVDRKTGNVWISTGRSLNSGTLNVFDPDGTEVAAWPIRALAMSYDAFSDSMWIVGYEIIKMNREGEILFRRKIDGWSCNGVLVESDGTVHVTERNHPDIAVSQNQILVLNNAGQSLEKIPLKSSPNGFAFDSKTGKYWVGEVGETTAGQDDSVVKRPTDASCGLDGIWTVDKTGLKQIEADGSETMILKSPDESGFLGVRALR